ncbi:hypothetical protein [Burkholderia multivorans]|uniref:hypothetical protein n=1 Tax=Burkholderia multivorans TaxID=87883 RepID=UPI0012DEFDB9|nr:hypothetical protein [Burkholderia multivorans]QGR92734.1 hypothetical protein FOC30_17465 [Burkholderia multivorans]HEJ2443633.1 hypothetical protein [Burkholderia multivorans]
MSFTPYLERPLNGGTQKLYRFENGFGASVVQHAYSYGRDAGQWELAVIRFDGDEWDLEYGTEITDDVIGRLDWDEVEDLLSRISALQTT